MDARRAREYLLDRPDAWEDYPFGPDVAVFKISSRMFATLGEGGPQPERQVDRVNLKCDPQEALFLRDMFDAVKPGYHMNKNHWNTVILDGSVPAFELERMMDRSYALVVGGLRKTERERLILVHGGEAIEHR